MALAAARDRKRRAIARPRKKQTPSASPDAGPRDYQRFRQNSALHMEASFKLPLPEPVRPLSQQYRLQGSQQESSSSRTVSRDSRCNFSPLILQGQAGEPPTTTIFETELDGLQTEMPALELNPPSPYSRTSAMYSASPSTIQHYQSHSRSTSPYNTECRHILLRDRRYRDLQLEMRELRTQQSWGEKELKICGLKRKVYEIEDEREDEEMEREDVVKRRRREVEWSDG
jgi:hypothetical protein